jgi:hypothetical protein
MQPQFQHKLITSFSLWLDNHLLTKAQAFRNVTGQTLIYNADSTLADQTVFSSAYKQWVFDSSIPGATVNNYISGLGYASLHRALYSDLKIDYNNGRIMYDSSTSAITSSTSLKANFAVKDFNIYVTDESEEDLVIENKYKSNSRYSSLTESTAIEPYVPVTPAIFVTFQESQNKPFALGGMDETRTDVRCVVFAENSYQLDGALSVFNDATKSTFALLDFEDYPLNEYGDLKAGSETYNLSDGDGNPYFNYTGLAASKNSQFFIEEVIVSKLSDRIKEKINPNLFIGFIDFQISKHRNPRL